jgi:hypothetical protein
LQTQSGNIRTSRLAFAGGTAKLIAFRKITEISLDFFERAIIMTPHDIVATTAVQPVFFSAWIEPA